MKARKILVLLLVVSLLMSLGALTVVAQEPDPNEGTTIVEPTEEPIVEPTEEPPVEPTEEPIEEPPVEPTEEPTEEPIVEPTEEPTAEPTEEPPVEPTEEPVAEPTEEPVAEPTEEPTVEPTEEPTGDVGAAAWVEPGTGSTDVFAQNTDTVTTNSPITVIAEYIGPGCPRDACTASQSVAPLASREFSAVDSPVGDGWMGSMVLASEGPALAVAQTSWSGGDRYGAYTGFNQGSTDVYLPILYKLDGRQNSALAVQNTTTSDGVTVYIDFYNGDTGLLDHQIVDTLDSGEEKYYSVTDYPEIEFVGGSAHVHSTQEIAAVAITHWGEANPNYSAMYSGFSAGQMTLYQPVQYRLHQSGNWWTYSAIVIQNTSSTTVANVTMRYYGDESGGLDLEFTADIQPNASRGFNTMNGGTVDASTFNPLVGTGTSSVPWWGGSVVIESNVPVVGVGNTLWYSEQKSAQYGLAGSADSGTGLYFPAIQRSGSPWSYWSAPLIQNLSGTQANVNMYFYDRDGNLDLYLTGGPITIEPYSGRGFNTRNGGTVDASEFDPLGNNWEGSVYVTSDQFIIGATQLVYSSDSSAYNAMAAP